MLTSAAALITAVTGLIVALHQGGGLDKGGRVTPPTEQGTPPRTTPTPGPLPLPRPTFVLRPITWAQLRVTSGVVDPLSATRLLVQSARMRAVVKEPTGPAVEVRFAYLGPSAETAPLEDGQVRRQIGLTRRAQDDCTVLHLLWNVEALSPVVVAITRNIGQPTQPECGAHGYHPIKPTAAISVLLPKPGEFHLLRAEIRREKLEVFVDERLVWERVAGAETLAFDGPVGLRTDNGLFDVELAAEFLPTTGVP